MIQNLSKKDPLNLIIAGVGGQGNVLLSRLIGRALVKNSYVVTIGETYGASQRGGAVVSHVRISADTDYGPLTPAGGADIIIGLEPVEMLRTIGRYGNPTVVALSNSRPVYTPDAAAGEVEYPSLEQVKKVAQQLSQKAWFVDATGIALELGSSILTNIVMGGVAIGLDIIPLTPEDFEAVLREQFAADRYDLNLRAFRKGLEVGSRLSACAS